MRVVDVCAQQLCGVRVVDSAGHADDVAKTVIRESGCE
jgi:hypothetical protein